jgi:hypothetical protein
MATTVDAAYARAMLRARTPNICHLSARSLTLKLDPSVLSSHLADGDRISQSRDRVMDRGRAGGPPIGSTLNLCMLMLLRSILSARSRLDHELELRIIDHDRTGDDR